MASGHLGSTTRTGSGTTTVYSVPAGKTAVVNVDYSYSLTKTSSYNSSLTLSFGGFIMLSKDTAVDGPISGQGQFSGVILGAGEAVTAASVYGMAGTSVSLKVRVTGFEETQ